MILRISELTFGLDEAVSCASTWWPAPGLFDEGATGPMRPVAPIKLMFSSCHFLNPAPSSAAEDTLIDAMRKQLAASEIRRASLFTLSTTLALHFHFFFLIEWEGERERVGAVQRHWDMNEKCVLVLIKVRPVALFMFRLIRGCTSRMTCDLVLPHPCVPLFLLFSWLFFVFLSFVRWKRRCSEEDFHEMGELTAH